MTSRFGVLSIPLLCVVMLLAYKNYEIWSHPPPWTPKKVEGKRAGENRPEAASAAAGWAARAAQEPLQIVAERNIFAPDRKEFPVQAVAEQAKPVVRPQVILYGVMIGDEYQTASVANPGRPLFKGERETKTVKLGDRIGEYRLTRILPDRIALEAAGDSFEVLLFDPKTPKKRTEVKTASKPAEVISTAPAQPSAAPPTGGPPAILPAPVPRPIPAAAPPASAGPAKVDSAQPGPAPPIPQIPDPNLLRNRRGIYSRIPATPGTQQ